MPLDFERLLKFLDQARIGRGLRNRNRGTKAASGHRAGATSPSRVAASSPSPNTAKDEMWSDDWDSVTRGWTAQASMRRGEGQVEQRR
jgi:hypothetical protein